MKDNVFCGPPYAFINIKSPRNKPGDYAVTLVKNGATFAEDAERKYKKAFVR